MINDALLVTAILIGTFMFLVGVVFPGIVWLTSMTRIDRAIKRYMEWLERIALR